MSMTKHRNTYNWDLDRINCLYLIVPAFGLACLIHPGLNRSYFGDVNENKMNENLYNLLRSLGLSLYTLSLLLCCPNYTCSPRREAKLSLLLLISSPVKESPEPSPCSSGLALSTNSISTLETFGVW